MKLAPGLYLIPNTLGSEAREEQILGVLPAEVIHIAAQIQYWIVENAKTSRALLKAIDQHSPLQNPLQQLHMQEWRGSHKNRDSLQARDLLKPCLEGHALGLMSEAGLPAIADPGAEIVAAAHELKITVHPLVGPSSILLALMASGLNGQSFSFHGYLPTAADERTQAIKALESHSRKSKQTQIWIETPYRNSAMLDSLIAATSDSTRLCLACDLTLPSQKIITQTRAQWQKFMKHDVSALQNLNQRPAIFLLLA